MTADIRARLDLATALAEQAGELALGFYHNLDQLAVEHKGPQDVVSRADREVEALIRAEIARRFPADGFLGEESGSSNLGGDQPIWVVDPIDGTQPFLSHVPNWCISIGIVAHGKVVAGVIRDPCADETFRGLMGAGATCNGRPIRPTDASDFTHGMTEVGYAARHPVAPTTQFIEKLLDGGGMFHHGGSGALGIAYVAAGRYVAYFESHMHVWDTCAGVALVSAAGGWAHDILANDGLHNGAVAAASSQRLAPSLRALARETGHAI